MTEMGNATYARMCLHTWLMVEVAIRFSSFCISILGIVPAFPYTVHLPHKSQGESVHTNSRICRGSGGIQYISLSTFIEGNSMRSCQISTLPFAGGFPNHFQVILWRSLGVVHSVVQTSSAFSPSHNLIKLDEFSMFRRLGVSLVCDLDIIVRKFKNIDPSARYKESTLIREPRHSERPLFFIMALASVSWVYFAYNIIRFYVL